MSDDLKAKFISLTGADIHQQRAQMQSATAEVFADLKLRQWAFEQAMKCSDAFNVDGIQELTKFAYNFATKKENSDEQAS